MFAIQAKYVKIIMVALPIAEKSLKYLLLRGRRDSMVDGFTTTCAISVYYH